LIVHSIVEILRKPRTIAGRFARHFAGTLRPFERSHQKTLRSDIAAQHETIYTRSHSGAGL